MDFANDVFDWGSWANAFFLPRPCMLKYDGTVDYYLDPEDYAKKADGTASDVANAAYGGNAMMEWGRDGKRIWYKIVPDSEDPTCANVFIADHRADPNYRAWSFVNNQGAPVEHFYTPIYNGSIDGNGRLRSLSDVAKTELCQNKTVAQEIAAAELNNPGEDKLWYTEVYADVTLVNLLLVLMAKSLDTQGTYGLGRCGQGSAANTMLGTGTMNDKGLFWGSSEGADGVKVFGMENWWGNQWRRYAGHVMTNYVQKYKMTRDRQDGSTADDYNSDGSGYLTSGVETRSSGFIKKMRFDSNTFQPLEVGGSSASYWCDRVAVSPDTAYLRFGGASNTGVVNYLGGFYLSAGMGSEYADMYNGAAPSCKPLI